MRAVVTDEIDPKPGIRVETRLNGVLKQQGNRRISFSKLIRCLDTSPGYDATAGDIFRLLRLRSDFDASRTVWSLR